MNGAEGQRLLPETMGPGIALLDFDADGDLDLYCLQSGPLPGRGPGLPNRLFANDGSGAFTEVAGAAGADDVGYGMGAALGDFDGDGTGDLLVLNWGPDRLFRGVPGEARFEPATGFPGGDAWSVSAVFFDADADGDEDLYIVHYLRVTLQDHIAQGFPGGFHGYPHPDRFPAAFDTFLLNDGGSFTDATRPSGLREPGGKGLGVVAADLDRDGQWDLYVANDSTANFLFLQDGASGGPVHFTNRAGERGCAYNADGRTEAGMGVACGDPDEDGDLDLFVTHLDGETNTLYVNDGRGFFHDGTAAAGLAAPSLPWVGFGTAFLDADADGHLDLLVANGHIIDNIDEMQRGGAFPQPDHLYLGDGAGHFTLHDEPALAIPGVGRGLAVGDLDGDGDPDFAVSENGGGVRLFRNSTNRRSSLDSPAVRGGSYASASHRR